MSVTACPACNAKFASGKVECPVCKYPIASSAPPPVRQRSRQRQPVTRDQLSRPNPQPRPQPQRRPQPQPEPHVITASLTVAPWKKRLKPSRMLALMYTLLGPLAAVLYAAGTGYAYMNDNYDQAWIAIYVSGTVMGLSWVVFLFWLYRAWNTLPEEYQIGAPSTIVGMLFVPGYNLYWLFRAISGLSRNMSLSLRSFEGTGGRDTAPGVATAACVLACIPIVGLLAPFMFAIWINAVDRAKNDLIAIYHED